ncbi:unnamed protein product [Peniophora sp. CBMAI 1063]|nr:unnamed protein product [Peniophora sp. CBMAI 1063]
MYSLGLTILALALGAQAHSNGMDMSMDSGASVSMGNMIMYLHFTPGDNLWFYGWAPRTAGAMGGTCVALVMLALVERWLSALKACAEMHWHQRALIEMANRTNKRTTLGQPQSTPTKIPRTALPFIAAHDLPRGLITAILALLGFLFMLAVMTYQVGFILSIVIGLGVGEALFGRYTRGTAHTLH